MGIRACRSKNAFGLVSRLPKCGPQAMQWHVPAAPRALTLGFAGNVLASAIQTGGSGLQVQQSVKISTELMLTVYFS